MAGAIAMLAVFLVVVTEMFFATRGAGHSHDSDWTHVPEEPASTSLRGGQGFQDSPLPTSSLPLSNLGSPYADSANGHAHTPKPANPRAGDDCDSDSDDGGLDDLEALDPIVDDSEETGLTRPHHLRHDPHAQRMKEFASSTTDPQKLFLQCLLLEAGILFHSIFIGMAVSVATGTAFIVLLIAICFHQTFEGFALGSRIAALIPDLFPPSSPKPWLMALAYGTTTPIGQAIGIWAHTLYDPLSKTGLLMVGITNAISSGLLLFAGLVQLIAEDFLSDESYRTLRGRRRVEASLAVGLGGLLMAVVGAWA